MKRARAIIPWLVFGVLAVVLVSLVAGLNVGSRVSPDQMENSPPNRFLSANRDELAICVESEVPSRPATEVASSIRGAASELEADEDWAALTGGEPVEVAVGCQSSGDWSDLRPVQVPPGEAASAFRLHVFVIDDVRTVAAGASEFRVFAREVELHGSEQVEVSTGLFLSPEQAADTEYLAEALAFSFFGGKLVRRLSPLTLLPGPLFAVDVLVKGLAGAAH